MKKFISIILLVFTAISVYANSNSFSLSKMQQNRLSSIIKQLKVPQGEYKLIVSNSGTALETHTPMEPKVVTKEVEVTKEVVKEVPVEKIVEKIVTDPRIVTGSVILSPQDVFILNHCQTVHMSYSECVYPYLRSIWVIDKTNSQ